MKARQQFVNSQAVGGLLGSSPTAHFNSSNAHLVSSQAQIVSVAFDKKQIKIINQEVGGDSTSAFEWLKCAFGEL